MAPIDRLPDISMLGRYTYLATEVVFGAFAAGLLYRASALRRAAVTIATMYPIAYAWDWYTLEVGVFSVDLRTGRELLGIPIEEHLFAIVVPGFVLAIHETLHGPDDAAGGVRGAVANARRSVGDARRTVATTLGEALPGFLATRLPGVEPPADGADDSRIRGVGVDVAEAR